MPKLGRVEHHRCDEYYASTYVWVPDDWTEDQFSAAVYRAQKAYQAFVDSYKPEPPNDYSPHKAPPYNDHLNWTVREVQLVWADKKKIYDDWKLIESQARRSFGDYLADEGLKNIFDVDPDFEAGLGWGHQHGKNLELSEFVANDLDGPLKKDDW